VKRVLTAAAVVLATPIMLAAAQTAKEPYAPGLGEFMLATQLRHAKLWFAGRAQNWNLAAYEIDEIKEGLEDAAKEDPTHDGLPIPDMIKSNTEAPLQALDKVVEAKNGAKFAVAFDDLTKACNNCHASAKREFIKIQRPTAVPFSNQVFRP
jgi:hypothetical protein